LYVNIVQIASYPFLNFGITIFHNFSLFLVAALRATRPCMQEQGRRKTSWLFYIRYQCLGLIEQEYDPAVCGMIVQNYLRPQFVISYADQYKARDKICGINLNQQVYSFLPIWTEIRKYLENESVAYRNYLLTKPRASCHYPFKAMTGNI
jgi:hypothetical protein